MKRLVAIVLASLTAVASAPASPLTGPMQSSQFMNTGSENLEQVAVRGGPGGRGGVGRPGVGRPGAGFRPGVGRPGVGRPGVGRPGVGRPGVGVGYRPGGRWVRPHYRWAPGGAIAAGAALGFIAAAAAASWAGAPPAPGYCWYYTDPSQTQGFWDVCP